ncbi:TetR/AcrR family transcriptional regulator [Marinihelvus fidelis]|uniref:TetR/AcrR family transcriptional regulator n=1 Tax=Marinihelvus fidelis TaxID=2613842 RepID=A0A5N0T5D9_9GAMM|nr:TetR/AcrR family transcriptional regulator [Marinihelvus fidelis]KAA9129694.1 TetR/AcrR family transcriptional regulator [Marinihelvus fidelis]
MNRRPRQRGRPADAENEDRRADLLDEAERQFAEQGYAATSVRSIAEAAGVTPAMVHYYFGSKRELLTAVLDRVLQPLMEKMAALKAAPEPALDPVIEALASTMAAHPALPRLVTREALLPGGELADHFAEHYAPRLGGLLPGLIARGQSEGRLSDRHDPRHLALFLIGLSMFPFIARPLAEPVLGLDYDKDGGAGLAREIVAIFQRAIQP